MSGLHAYHHSHKERYRDPFGARPCGDRVTLRLMVGSDSPVRNCSLHLHMKGKETRKLMEPVYREDLSSLVGHPATGSVFETAICLPAEPGLVWYSFRLKVDGHVYYYHNNREELGGEGVLSQKKGPPFQITVYKPSEVPRWFKEGIMYQIYVDRFFNGSPGGEVLYPKRKSLIHAHWDDTPVYVRDGKGRVTRWTFFGGNLEGVIAKLPYLQELGITIIYLNPIFEAASNHKYDTGDYLKIDPMYGDLATFARLVDEAAKLGISVILDGVFSHTGADSRYFNRYGHYPELGAFQSAASPYYSWYKLERPGGEYEAWWGEEDLPNVKELDPSFQDFILGRDKGVARFWLNRGARGWRLDVADELPDEFIKLLRLAVKETDPEAVLIGEVWEDASNKISYGERREYLLGDELDSVMNYPLREILLDYFLKTRSAGEAVARIMSLCENYPPENFRAAMNLIGSHDRIRILTLLGEAPVEGSLEPVERESYRLSGPARERAIKRLKLMALLQMTLPGVPCIYYGDEAGLEGYSDPYNRGTFPWGREDGTLLDWHKRLVKLRREYDVLRDGEFEPFSIGDDVLGFRKKSSEEEIIVCVNRSQSDEVEVDVTLSGGGPGTGEREVGGGARADEGPRPEDAGPRKTHAPEILALDILALELLSGERLRLDSSVIRSALGPLEGKVFYSKRMRPKTATSACRERSCGILLHLTSLPSRWGIGDMGEEAERFVDFLASSGQSLWQILPLNPLGQGNSPYQSPSVMAGNALLISPDRLREDGLITDEEIQTELNRLTRQGSGSEAGRVNYSSAAKVKERLFRVAWRRHRARLGDPAGVTIRRDTREVESYAAFVRENAVWLDDYCLFTAFKKRNGNLSWPEWDRDIAMREPGTLTSLREEMSDEIEYRRFLQYTFFRQWERLKRYANSRGVKIIGDVPIYVAADSSDTWANKTLFKLDSEGNPLGIAGVPPDYFSETGQLWENPVYDWREMEKHGYAWWKDRVRQLLRTCDYIRLDHFRGFEAFWEIPGGEETAVNGRWLKGPGKRFFKALEEEFGELPFIAEDLGYLTAEVRNLKSISGLPGMRIYQFEASPDLGDERLDELLRAEGRDIAYYSGTHDNDTLLGWYSEQRHTGDLSAQEKKELVEQALERIYLSGANWVIIPLQDILGLDSAARMNTPGTKKGNWAWRMEKDDLTRERAEWLRLMAVRSGRAGD